MSKFHGSVHTFNFRPAQLSDGSKVAAMMFDAAPRMLIYSLDAERDQAIAFIQYCFDKDVGFYGRSYQYVACRADEIVMTMTLYSGREYERLVKEFVLAAFRFFGFFKMLRLVYRSMQTRHLYEKPAPSSLMLANACVAVSGRGQGVFTSAFADHVLPFAKERRLGAIELDVGMDNPRAHQLYQRLGFKEVKSNRYTGDADIDGVIRMSRLVQ